MVLKGIRALELHVRRPLSAPETQACRCLRPREGAATKAVKREPGRRRRGDRVREERHEARRPCDFSRVSTAVSTTFRPR
jgi:hypothetical protein